MSAPHLLHPVPDDFALQALCLPAFPDRPAQGGLLLWQDEQNFLRLDWGIDGPRSVSLRGAIANQDQVLGRGCLPEAQQAFLRLERRAGQVKALASHDGQQWFLVAEVGFPTTTPLAIGPFAGGLVPRWFYPGAHLAGSALRFQGLTIWCDAEESERNGQSGR